MTTVELTEQTGDLFADLLRTLYDYYQLAPVVFWAIIGCIIWALTMWGWRGRNGKREE